MLQKWPNSIFPISKATVYFVMDFSQYFSRLVRFKSIEKHVLNNGTFFTIKGIYVPCGKLVRFRSA